MSQHSKCVVQSYLKWLEDSDYDLNCALCNQSIQEGETVRLICYDLFHLPCLDRYVKSLPHNTTPSAYRCPKCNERDILPPSNMVSPVAQALRQRLMTCSWAKDGSDLEQFFTDLSVTQNDSTTPPDEDLTDFGTLLTSTPAKTSSSPPPPPSSYNHPAVTLRLDQSSLVSGIPANQGYDQPLIRNTAGSQPRFVAVDASALGADSGSSSSKYKTRSLKQLLPRWCRYRLHLTMDETAVMLRRYSILTLLAVFGVVILILVLTRASQTTAQHDGPKLGWQQHAN